MKTRTTLLGLAVLCGAAAPTLAQEFREAPDRTWISLTGTIASTEPEAFTLECGDDEVTVEMDDWDAFDEALLLEAGQRVTVYGRIDDGLYEKRTVEADSVYVEQLGTFYYASDADEEGDHIAHLYLTPVISEKLPDGTWLAVSGEVVDIDGRELTLDNGLREIVVDTDEMAYNPLDDVGHQQIEEGHRLYVSGTLDVGFFEADEIKAATIVTLDRCDRKTQQAEQSMKKQDQGSKSSGSRSEDDASTS